MLKRIAVLLPGLLCLPAVPTQSPLRVAAAADLGYPKRLVLPAERDWIVERLGNS